jgi:hypothetical protein
MEPQLPDPSLWRGVRLSLVAVMGIQIGLRARGRDDEPPLQGDLEMTLGNRAVV